MKKLLLILLCLPMVMFGQTSWIPCDSSFSISINSQDSMKVVYSVSGPNFNMNSNFSWVYFNMIGQCIGGSNSVASHIDTLNALNINNITDSTAIMCLISDSLSSCIVVDTLVYDSLSGWSLLSVQVSTSQTYVPDDNFEAYLEANGMGNGVPNDNYVTTANINTIDSLDVNYYSISMNISDLTGIEDFISLIFLDCSYSQISNLDVSQNIYLKGLYCSMSSFANTFLTTLDVSQNTALTSLNCAGNQLTSLDLSQNNNLEWLVAQNNLLTTLDVSQNTALKTLSFWNNNLTTLDVSQNTNLEYLSCHSNPLNSLDLSQNTALTYLNCNNNGLTSLDLSQNTGLTFINCNNNLGLTSLDVSNHLALTFLDCHFTQIDTLDLSQNTALTYLHVTSLDTLDLSNNPDLLTLKCKFNQTNIDLSQNTSLKHLECGYGQLTTLDLSQNTDLTLLKCPGNQLTELDISQNDSLEEVWAQNNQLTSLNLSSASNTSLLSLNVSNNPSLYCIDVDDVFWANNNFTNDYWPWMWGTILYIDSCASFSANCAMALGCTDSLAINYDSLATIDDSSCIYCNLSIDSLIVTQTTCYAYYNGSVNINVYGGLPPFYYYTYRLNPTDTIYQGASPFTIALGPAIYVAVVEDSIGCSDKDTFEIYSLDSVYVSSIQSQEVSCNGYNDGGIINIIGSGGIPPYLYSLNGGFISANNFFSNLIAGVYTVGIWDSSSCVNSLSIKITEPPIPISYDTITAAVSYYWGTNHLTLSGDYTDTLVGSMGCDSIANLNLTITNTTGMSDKANSKSNLVKITDMLGRETKGKKNEPLLYLYDDGTVEKRIVIE